MHPIICKIGPLTVYSYGVMMALAVVLCTLLLSRDARRLNIKSEIIFDLVFWVVCSGILGARIFYVFLNLDYFSGNPLEIIQIQKGGLAWQGGLIAGTLTGILYIRRHALPLGKTADLVAPYIALGHAIGRIGCFLNGCCYGKEVSWGIYFPIHHAHLHPTQLYESVGLFFIFLILKKYQKFNQIPGRVFIAYLFLASLERFVVEFFRADHLTTWLGLSIFQWVSLIVLSSVFYAHTIIQSRFRK
ncbi:MAG TPA: prolipoprotein diacylglyceryl transferase [Candidatus Omnitrophota bacterium]|nr:prolipoprotein diacylglyceryl transferase [Candidatus Omnitrophota bacterium]